MQRIENRPKQSYTSSLQTNFGWLRPVSNGINLIRLDWNQTGWDEPDRPDNVSRETTRQLQAYFNNQLYKFVLPLAPIGKTTASQYWLDSMSKIPYATTISYAAFAIFAGKPNAQRAAGTACATNPIPIIYPCHRVIRANGTLGNYGGGSSLHNASSSNLARKAALLRLEAQGAACLTSRNF